MNHEHVYIKDPYFVGFEVCEVCGKIKTEKNGNNKENKIYMETRKSRGNASLRVDNRNL